LIVANVVLLKVVYISASCMCNSYRDGEVVQSVGCGTCLYLFINWPTHCLSIGSDSLFLQSKPTIWDLN